jgi:hypothetical protein
MKQRKHSKSQTRSLTRRLLQLLGKLLKEIRKMEREHAEAEVLTDKERKTIDIVTRVYRQQSNHFESGNPRESIPDRIVSVSKPYVRPIVRGKEEKKTDDDAGYTGTANRVKKYKYLTASNKKRVFAPAATPSAGPRSSSWMFGTLTTAPCGQTSM